jgi:hypothetical protein
MNREPWISSQLLDIRERLNLGFYADASNMIFVEDEIKFLLDLIYAEQITKARKTLDSRDDHSSQRTPI